MTRLSLSIASPSTTTAEALVLGVYQGKDGPVAADPAFDAAVPALALAGAGGSPGTVTTIPAAGLVSAERIIGVGLGRPPAEADTAQESAAHRERVRQAAGAASRSAAGQNKVVSTLSLIDLGAAAEGHLLGAYVFDTYKAVGQPPVGQLVLSVPSADKSAKAELRRAEITVAAVAFARSLVNSAPNDLPPAVFADRAAAAAREAGMTVQVLDEKELAKGGYGGILGVGSGSSRPPRLIRISYSPAGAKASVALVGKGITFDSGGLSIKPAAKMDQMTSDMAGAAAVIATAVAAAKLQLPIAVTATAALAENLPSGTAYRPGDVLRHYGGAKGKGTGKTVHVLNTDAEGRLVLADAIVRACEDNPDYLLETATLTGAQIVALGNRTMGVMGSPALRDRVAELAREVGEGGWAMPLPEHLREGLDSPLADLANIAGEPGGGMLVAGHYLAAFVPDGLDWAHLDVAGPAFNGGKAYGYTGPGGTGVPVRTLLAVLQDIAAR
ncbi:MAG TPA: leucyl aminopeptidase [Nakamurella sp.]|nr:leucyl aminopeptidase [Nakamurella sp.]